MKGILLVGGTGTRLHPMTSVISKQLIPIYDKPMVYYPLCTLMLAGIREILLVSTPRDLSLFRRLFGSGEQLGLSFSYAEQPHPEGIAQALIIGRDFIGDEQIALILGDNIFFSRGLGSDLKKAVQDNDGATIFCYRVKNPQNYGIADFDQEGNVISVVEKPTRPKTNFAVTGLYLYDNRALDIAASLRPSARGELEISDLNQRYIDLEALRAIILGRGTVWLDTGTSEALLQAGTFVKTVQSRQGFMISCIEEVAYRMGYIDKEQLIRLADQMGKNTYSEYLKTVAI